LFLAIDFVLSAMGVVPVDPRYRADDINRLFRIRSDVFHHGLKENYSGNSQFGRYIYPVYTNSLGFIDGEPRLISKDPEKPRLVIIGDSFGEGIGLAWRETFAGMLTESQPEREILNASVASYSPIIYYRKIRWLIEQGYRFDQLLVLVDISDIMDEAGYVMAGDAVMMREDIAKTELSIQTEGTEWVPGPTNPSGLSSLFGRDFRLSGQTIGIFKTALARLRRAVSGKGDTVPIDCRSAWTFDRANPATDDCYVDGQHDGLSPSVMNTRSKGLGASAPVPGANIDRNIERARYWMTQLHDLLRIKGIGLSVAVYPWPAQLHRDTVDSLQVQIWRTWCVGRCAHFVDLFPDFFDYKIKHAGSWYSDLFINGDVHYNAQGNQMLARKLRAVVEAVRR
jgi:hypothetical protein